MKKCPTSLPVNKIMIATSTWLLTEIRHSDTTSADKQLVLSYITDETVHAVAHLENIGSFL